ncbi:hypothetical protein HBH46_088730 [Parastagonospora nodorum]|nr:hypothetical protein HBH46_088730 [Parastagonospora nodorum]
MADSLRARTLINLSAVLYEQAAARTGLSAKVGNMDLDFVPGVAFISDVYIADSLRARTPINLSAVLYEQAAARTGLSAEVSNISPRARTLINLSAVLYEQVGIIDLNFVPGVAFDAIGNVELTGDLLGNADCVNNNNNNVVPTLQFSPTALLNPRSLASKRPQLHNVQKRTASLAKQIKTNEDRKKSTHFGDNIEKLICVGKVKHTYVQAHTVPYPNLKKYLGNSGQQGRIKVLFRQARNNRNNLNIIVTDPTGREFSRVDMKSLTRLSSEGPLGLPFSGLISMTLQFKFHKGKNIQLLRPTDQFTQQGLTPREPGSIYVLRSVDEIRADVADVFDTVVSKSDEVPTQELSSHIKTELYLHQKQALYFMWDKEQDHSAEEHDYRKFYRLIITGEDTHCKQTIKKAYIMSPERASLILFMT